MPGISPLNHYESGYQHGIGFEIGQWQHRTDPLTEAERICKEQRIGVRDTKEYCRGFVEGYAYSLEKHDRYANVPQ